MAWVRDTADLKDRNVDPNHGWRHTWKTIALGAGIEERIRDAITGHKVTSVGRRYEAPPVRMLAEALAKFPRYEVGYEDLMDCSGGGRRCREPRTGRFIGPPADG